ncbi:hypothetical protein QBC34DRAFT_189963 [Podospora aff. communis PSN243]|uniref:Uncharacterized protein n=1 Tax=Podospora aff. communis PSN243 TaxID=3040156 RepID=A0AAV9GYR1_9PEZI|nr:hypothetical protein QBC34DRAFT_189963 [Podospora aff. communis PSN243]
MTNHARGSSLLQARENYHRRLHNDNTNTNHHIRSSGEKKLQNRQVVVVQTVSVVHVIDETGAVIEFQTILPAPATQIPDQPAALTDGLPAANNISPSVIPAVEDVLPEGGAVPLVGSLSPSPDGGPATSSLLPSSSAFSSSPGGYNSTHLSSLFHNSTGLYSNSTRTSTLRSSYLTSSSSPSLTSIYLPPTDAAGGAGGNVDVNGVPGFAPTTAAPTAPESSSGSGLPPAAQSAVIGGVVGGVAGIAIVALVLMFVLKWKKGHRGGLMLLGDGDSTIGGKGLSLGPGYKPGGGPMAERSVPFAVPSALASLTGNKRALEDAPRQSAVLEEKGFHRVSGKKLISVLQSGGDGYSDPHASVMSGTSDYRNSEAFLGGSALPRLQLGSPMRPESGVMIMRSGPNRTPVQAQGPFSDPFADQPSPGPVTPPIQINGRSLTSRDDSASGGSASRFAETM